MSPDRAADPLRKQVSTLEAKGYVEVKKGYVGKRPRTWVSLSDAAGARWRAMSPPCNRSSRHPAASRPTPEADGGRAGSSDGTLSICHTGARGVRGQGRGGRCAGGCMTWSGGRCGWCWPSRCWGRRGSWHGARSVPAPSTSTSHAWRYTTPKGGTPAG
ncbi:transcriptional regulator [Streptomyces sp. NPDC002790]|uniref:transcriptional regulator n=1 Tax=Streptomyces sp. NPDC002790 TaxID=3154431 RepID=UPI0033329EEF